MHATVTRSVLKRGRRTNNPLTSRTISFVIATLIVISCHFSALAQQMKDLRGVVRDPLGALVSGASIDLLKDNLAFAHTITGANGIFQVQLPDSGRW